LNHNIQIIRYQECKSSLWKNGGGGTKQLWYRQRMLTLVIWF